MNSDLPVHVPKPEKQWSAIEGHEVKPAAMQIQ
jgi:hypothetical protein